MTTEKESYSARCNILTAPGSVNRTDAGESIPAWFLLSAICLMGLWLRLHALGARSLWLDEGVSAMIVRLPWSGFLALLQRREGNMALYYAALRGWTHFGTSEFTIRAMSVLAGILSVFTIYLLGKKLFSERAGLLSALLLAVHAFHIRYSQEARSYSLVVLLLLLSAYFFARAVEADADLDWLLFITFSVLSVYGHFFAGLVVAAEVSSLVFLPASVISRRRLLGVLVLFAGLIAPAVWYAYTHAHLGLIDWIPALTWRLVYSCAIALTGAGGLALLLAYSFACSLAFLPSIRVSPKLRVRAKRFPLALAACWVILPLAALLGASLLKPLLLDRYTSIFVPGVVLLAASGLARLENRWCFPAISTLALLSLIGMHSYLMAALQDGEDWRGAVAYAMRNAEPTDVAILNNGVARGVFEYYREKNGSSVLRVFSSVSRDEKLTYLDFEGIPNQRTVDRLAQTHNRVWMFDSSADSALSVLLDHRFYRGNMPKFMGLNVALYIRNDSHTSAP